MLAYRASEAAFMQIGKLVNVYLEHWLSLVEKGVPTEVISGNDPASLVQRDRLHRQALFNPEVDPVWIQVERLIGPEASERLRKILINQVLES
jgi:hypothetical protein